MEALLIKRDVPIGSRHVATLQGFYVIVETKEIGTISLVLGDNQLSISGSPDDWGGDVKDISVRVEKKVEEKELPKELQGLKIIKLKEDSKKIEVPDELVDNALDLAKKRAEYERAKEKFKKEHHGTIKAIIGRLHSTQGDQVIGGGSRI